MHDVVGVTPPREKRRGTILVATSVVLIALVGLLGLVIDAGQLMYSYRRTQNAADAAAMAAAMDLLSGYSSSTATSTATTFVQEYNGMANATVTVNIPPLTGNYTGSSNYAEAIVSFPVSTTFIQVLGVGATQTVTARAVAGWEGNTVAVGVMQLDGTANPGIALVGNGSLNVNGTVLVNSNAGGFDQNGNPINNGNGGAAIISIGNGAIYANNVSTVGGVSDPTIFGNYDPNNPASPLQTGVVAQADPFQNLPAPTTANGAVATSYGDVQTTGSSDVTLNPGVYNSISVSGNANVTMNPGIYVIAGGGLSMSGNATLTGSGVMLYNTGSDFNVNTGLPDSQDGSTAPPAAGSATFGAVTITGNAQLNLTPFSNSSSPFDGFVLYQRRLNTQPITIAGNGSSDSLQGTAYAKWAPLDLSGDGTFNSQFFVQSLVVSGNGNLTLDYTNQNLGKADLVYLVE
jgi:Flp pilus assembly protein TadG